MNLVAESNGSGRAYFCARSVETGGIGQGDVLFAGNFPELVTERAGDSVRTLGIVSKTPEVVFKEMVRSVDGNDPKTGEWGAEVLGTYRSGDVGFDSMYNEMVGAGIV